MSRLQTIFGRDDANGMTRRLFNRFLQKQSRVQFFEDPGLNAAAAVHPHIQYFITAALGVPASSPAGTGKTRIHQALKQAGWDISRLIPPTDLGVPAFNVGSKVWKTGDFANGLGVMINGVQYVYVVATHYDFDPARRHYRLRLKFLFYDVFGLDDDDLREYGATADDWLTSDAAKGITAWWQLQHQFRHAPLVTRIVVTRTFQEAAI